jgi:predicted phage-related endonuclease
MRGNANTVKRVSKHDEHRRDFIGGSDARIIMGQDEKALGGLPDATTSMVPDHKAPSGARLVDGAGSDSQESLAGPRDR